MHFRTQPLYFVTGSNGNLRYGFISNGTTILARTGNSDNTSCTVLEASTTAAGTVYVYFNAGCTVYGIDATNVDMSSNVDNIISPTLLCKRGNELTNPTNLAVELYNVMGVKVFTSAHSSIDLSNLNSGVYIAKTSEGLLKFVK